MFATGLFIVMWARIDDYLRYSKKAGLILLIVVVLLLWWMNGINMSLNDYRLFRLLFDPLFGFWAFVGIVFVCICLFFIGRNQYWPDGWKSKLVAIFYGSLSISMILMTFVFTFFFALPAYVTETKTPSSQIYGVVERLSFTHSRGLTSYYMYVNGRGYHIAQPWYNDLKVGQELMFITFNEHAFPDGFVDFTFVGMMVTLLVLVGWVFTLYLIVNGLLALFDRS